MTFDFFFPETGSDSIGQAGLEFEAILLSQPSESCDYRCEPPLQPR